MYTFSSEYFSINLYIQIDSWDFRLRNYLSFPNRRRKKDFTSVRLWFLLECIWNREDPLHTSG